MESNRGPSTYQPSTPYRLAKPAHSLSLWSMDRLSVLLPCRALRQRKAKSRFATMMSRAILSTFILLSLCPASPLQSREDRSSYRARMLSALFLGKQFNRTERKKSDWTYDWTERGREKKKENKNLCCSSGCGQNPRYSREQ